jgi:hypothetical protein
MKNKGSTSNRALNYATKAKDLAWQQTLRIRQCSSWLHYHTNSLCKPKTDWTWSFEDLLCLNTLEGNSFLLFSKLLYQLHWLRCLRWKHHPERVPKSLVHCSRHFWGRCFMSHIELCTIMKDQCVSSLHLHVYSPKKNISFKYGVWTGKICEKLLIWGN